MLLLTQIKHFTEVFTEFLRKFTQCLRSFTQVYAVLRKFMRNFTHFHAVFRFVPRISLSFSRFLIKSLYLDLPKLLQLLVENGVKLFLGDTELDPLDRVSKRSVNFSSALKKI